MIVFILRVKKNERLYSSLKSVNDSIRNFNEIYYKFEKNFSGKIDSIERRMEFLDHCYDEISEQIRSKKEDMATQRLINEIIFNKEGDQNGQ